MEYNYLFELQEQSASLVPVDKKTKRSITGWNNYKNDPLNKDQLTNYIAQGKTDFGMILGNADFHVIDVDTKNFKQIEPLIVRNTIWSEIPFSIKQKLTLQGTQSGGCHLIYRCQTDPQKQKLVENPETKRPFIETIGENNYILLYPENLISGSYSSCGYLTLEEHTQLLNCVTTVGNGFVSQFFTSSINVDTIQDRNISTFERKAQSKLNELQNEEISKPSNKQFLIDAANYIGEHGIDITDDYNDWQAIGYACANTMKENGREYFHKFSQNYFGYNESECNHVFDSMLKGIANKPITGASLRHILKKYGIEIPMKQSSTLCHTSSKKDKELNNTAKKTRMALEYVKSLELRRNEFTDNIEMSNGTLFSDSDLHNIYNSLRSDGVAITLTDIGAIVNSNSIDSYNPLMDWIKSAIGKADKSALDDLIACFQLKTEDAKQIEFLKQMMIKWLCQVPAVIMDGKMPRIAMVLIGGSYIGKTEFFRRLLPKKLHSYYAESTLDRAKDSELQMHENLLINLDEMGGIMQNSKNVERFKSLVSADRFNLRRPFGKINSNYKRRAILCGTSNLLDIIKDQSTENTRLIPFEIEQIDWVKHNTIDRDALFGYLAMQYKKIGDEMITFTNDDREQLSELSMDFSTVNIEAELIQRHFLPADADQKNFMTISEITEILLDFTKHNIIPRAVSRELKKLGFKKTRKRVAGYNIPQYGFFVKHKRSDGELETRVRLRQRQLSVI